jgi:hypothetical protein
MEIYNNGAHGNMWWPNTRADQGSRSSWSRHHYNNNVTLPLYYQSGAISRNLIKMDFKLNIMHTLSIIIIY